MTAVALVFTSVAGLIWFTFLRPVPAHTATGVVRSKTFKSAGEYWQQPAGNRDGFWAASRIPIAECYVFGVEVEGRLGEAQVSLNMVEAQALKPGQRVQIEYVGRGFPLIWRRVYVTDMRRVH